MAARRGRRKNGEPRLMGAKEASETLGVGQTNLRVIAGLPEPYDVVGATTLWRADEIEGLARERRAAKKMDVILRLEAAKRQAMKADEAA